MPELPRLAARRYVQPLREGGSLPAVVDTEDGLFVVKFRGAGQGAKVLVAELLVGMIARSLDLPVPDLALVDLDQRFGRSEPDPEIQDILRGSHGVNVGLRYLDGAFNYDPMAAEEFMDPGIAAGVVWLDALVTNPDRTHRNPNLLLWQRSPWLIDHGAALYAHHSWAGVDETRARTPFPLIEQHVLLTRASEIAGADERLAPLLQEETLRAMLDELPDELLVDPRAGDPFDDASGARERYLDYLLTRLREPRDFVLAADRARMTRLREPRPRLEARR